MPFTTLSGLQIKIPARGDRNWDAVMFTSTWTPISTHDHTGDPKGVQIPAGGLASNSVTTAKIVADAVTGAKIRLNNNEWLRARNNANSADVNLIKLNTSDVIEIGSASTQAYIVTGTSVKFSRAGAVFSLLKNDATGSLLLGGDASGGIGGVLELFSQGAATPNESHIYSHDGSQFLAIRVGPLGNFVYKTTAFQDGSNTTGSIKIGADDGFRTLTNNTAKRGMIMIPHYTNAEEPFGMMMGYSDATQNQIDIGQAGGNASNCATSVNFYAVANNTTTTGVRRARITSEEFIMETALSTIIRTEVASAAAITSLSSSTSFIKLTGSTATTVQGITAGTDGKIVKIVNLTGQIMTIAHENAGASASNRITTMTGADVATTANGTAEFIYDTGTSRWICLYVTP